VQGPLKRIIMQFKLNDKLREGSSEKVSFD